MNINDRNGVRKTIFDILAVSPCFKAKNQNTKASPLVNIPNQVKPASSYKDIFGISENIKFEMVMKINVKE
tara:strand:+ start:352 stop:564 length:213 start_codon:yes stop_codon:yes gene_type:complete